MAADRGLLQVYIDHDLFHIEQNKLHTFFHLFLPDVHPVSRLTDMYNVLSGLGRYKFPSHDVPRQKRDRMPQVKEQKVGCPRPRDVRSISISQSTPVPSLSIVPSLSDSGLETCELVCWD